MTQTVFEGARGEWCVQTNTGEDFFNEQHKRTSTYGRAKVCPIDEPNTDNSLRLKPNKTKQNKNKL